MDLLKETTEVRRAVISDTEDNTYIVSQTTPPLRRSSIGMTYRITQLTRQGDQHVRHGFEGKLIDIIKDYQLNSSQSVQASIFRRQSGLDPYDLRMHYRVKPGMDWGYTFSMESLPVKLVNISLGKALFSHDSKKQFESGQAVQITGQGSDKEQLPRIIAKVKRVTSVVIYEIKTDRFGICCNSISPCSERPTRSCSSPCCTLATTIIM